MAGKPKPIEVAGLFARSLWVLVPVLIYLGLQVLEPGVLGMLLLLGVAMRFHRGAFGLVMGLHSVERFVVLALIGFCVLIAAANSEHLLRAYPVVVSFGMLALFGHTLIRPPSMVERFARIEQPDLSLQGVSYTRRVTYFWCGFFVVNGLIALYTVFSTREHWLLWNGLLSYLAMGTLFAGEWLIRRQVRRHWGDLPHTPVASDCRELP